MTLSVKVGGAWKTVNNIWVRKGGVWKGVSKLSVRTGGAWKLAHDDSGSVPPDVAGGFNAHLNKSSVSGSVPGIGVVTTDSVTAVVDEGTAPYTYAWSKVSGSTFNIGSPAAATTNFNINTTTPDTTLTAIYKCTVTDNVGRTMDLNINVSASSGHNLMTVKININYNYPDYIGRDEDGDGFIESQYLAARSTVTGAQGSVSYKWTLEPGDCSIMYRNDTATVTMYSGYLNETPPQTLTLTVTTSTGQVASDSVQVG